MTLKRKTKQRKTIKEAPVLSAPENKAVVLWLQWATQRAETEMLRWREAAKIDSSALTVGNLSYATDAHTALARELATAETIHDQRKAGTGFAAPVLTEMGVIERN